MLGLTTETINIMKKSIEKLNAAMQSRMELDSLLDVLERFFTFSEKHKDIFLFPAATVRELLAESMDKFNAGTHSKPDLNHVLEVLEKLIKFSQKHREVTMLPTTTITKILTQSIERFNHKMDLPSLRALERTMKFSKNYGHLGLIPASKIKSLFSRVLQPPINALVQRTPQEPRDWKRGAMACHAATRNDYGYTINRAHIACADCAELNRFLASPTEQVARFRWAGTRRTHISKELNPRHYDLYTDKGGTPFTLIITKTKRQYEDQLATWKRDIARLYDQLAPFRNTWGKHVLGEKYSQLILIGDVLLKEQPASSAATTSVQAPRPAAAQNSNPPVSSAAFSPIQAPRPATVQTSTVRVPSVVARSVQAPRPAAILNPGSYLPSAATTALHARTSQSLNFPPHVPQAVAGTKRKAESQLSVPAAAKKKSAGVVIELSDED